MQRIKISLEFTPTKHESDKEINKSISLNSIQYTQQENLSLSNECLKYDWKDIAMKNLKVEDGFLWSDTSWLDSSLVQLSNSYQLDSLNISTAYTNTLGKSLIENEIVYEFPLDFLNFFIY